MEELEMESQSYFQAPCPRHPERYREEASADASDSEEDETSDTNEDEASMASADNSDELASDRKEVDLVFGSFRDSDLDAMSVTPIEQIKPVIDGSSVKIGGITCFLVTCNGSTAMPKLRKWSSLTTAMVAMDHHLPTKCRNSSEDFSRNTEEELESAAMGEAPPSDLAIPLPLPILTVEEEASKSQEVLSESAKPTDLAYESDVSEAAKKPKEFTNRIISTFVNCNLDLVSLCLESVYHDSTITATVEALEPSIVTTVVTLESCSELSKLLDGVFINVFDRGGALIDIVFAVGFRCLLRSGFGHPGVRITIFDPVGILTAIYNSTVASPEKMEDRTLTVLAEPQQRFVLVFDPGGDLATVRKSVMRRLHNSDSSLKRQWLAPSQSAFIKFFTATLPPPGPASGLPWVP